MGSITSRSLALVGLSIALGVTGSNVDGRAIAQVVPNDIPVGTCVTAYGQSGRIVDTVQGGYRIASDPDPSGTPFVAAASGTARSPCKAADAVANTTTPMKPRAAAPASPPTGGACFASSTAGLGGQASIYARLIIGNWAAPAPPGSDGAVTVKVNTLKIGASRRATFYDRDNASLDARAPVTPVVADVTLCTDYRTRLDMRQVRENFLCYTKGAGGLSCSETGHTADLPQPRSWSIDKR